MAVVRKLLSNREDGPDCVSTASCLACPEGSEIKSELFLYTVQLNTFYAVSVVWRTLLSKVSDVVTWCRDTLTLTLDWACDWSLADISCSTPAPSPAPLQLQVHLFSSGQSQVSGRVKAPHVTSLTLIRPLDHQLRKVKYKTGFLHSYTTGISSLR